MKRWEMPTVEEVMISDTQNGGDASRTFDEKWFDSKGALHVTFAQIAES